MTFFDVEHGDLVPPLSVATDDPEAAADLRARRRAS
jgi:hypothetical protein